MPFSPPKKGLQKALTNGVVLYFAILLIGRLTVTLKLQHYGMDTFEKCKGTTLEPIKFSLDPLDFVWPNFSYFR